MIISLDVATTTGVAIYYGGSNIETFTITGDAIYQFSEIERFLTEDAVLLIEALVDFRFPTAIKKLSGIHGYLTYSFLSEEYPVYLIKPTNVRSVLGVKKENKKTAKLVMFERLRSFVTSDSYKFTTDHSDAVAMILAYKHWTLDSQFTIDVLHSQKQKDRERLPVDLKMTKG